MNILDYTIETSPVTRILINLDNGKTVIADFGTLIELDENAGMYLNDAFYYSGEIQQLCELFLEEVRTEDYKYL